MSDIWITADIHYNHENIIKYCNRPFNDASHMNEALIKNINDLVQPNDNLYHLGDWAFGGIDVASECRERIKCKNVWNITGNHDHYKNEEDQKRFNKLFVENIPYKEINAYSKKNVLCHYAMRVWNKSHKNRPDSISSIHCFGHSHGALSDDKKVASLDVGVDICYEGVHKRFHPFSMDEIIEIMKMKEIEPPNFKDKWEPNPETW